jgi:hypothetical protein
MRFKVGPKSTHLDLKFLNQYQIAVANQILVVRPNSKPPIRKGKTFAPRASSPMPRETWAWLNIVQASFYF